MGVLDRAERDPDAHGAAQQMLIEQKGSSHRRLRAFCNPQNMAGVGTPFQQDGKLVSPEARQDEISTACGQGAGYHVGLVETVVETQADLDKQLIAHRGAERVVQGLEAIQVTEQNRVMETCIASSLCITTLQPVKKETAVGQVGQGVMQGVVGQFFFRVDALGDVPVDDHQLLDLAVLVLDGSGGGLENSPGPVLMAQAILQALADAGGACLAPCLQYLETIVGMDLFEDRSLAEFARRVAQDPLIGRAVVEAMPLGVDQGNHVGCDFGNDAKQFFALLRAPMSQIDPNILRGYDQQEHGHRDGNQGHRVRGALGLHRIIGRSAGELEWPPLSSPNRSAIRSTRKPGTWMPG
jgi:hypothetical protein